MYILQSANILQLASHLVEFFNLESSFTSTNIKIKVLYMWYIIEFYFP